VDCGAEVDALRRVRIGRVRSDPGSIAAIAARVLLSSGYGDFAFVPNGVPLPWSVERGAAFEHCIEVAGKRFHRFERPPAAPPPNSAVNEGYGLERWLEALPKPCGIFAANDAVGEEVLGACAHLGISVPDKVAVIGVDNHEYFCEATTPTLSSIALDLRAEGRAAVELLATMFAASVRKSTTRFIAARSAVLRSSTRYARDRRVARALEFIRLNACTDKFGPRDVVREMGVSRTLADILFRKTLGQTILDEIHAVRLDRAKELLASGTAPDIVGAECGYASHDDFRRVFRKRIGTTIRKWTLSRTF
jgi:LacI family transcriptional regulator